MNTQDMHTTQQAFTPRIQDLQKTIYNPKGKSKEQIKDILEGEIHGFMGKNPDFRYIGIIREIGRFGEWNYKITFKHSSLK